MKPTRRMRRRARAKGPSLWTMPPLPGKPLRFLRAWTDYPLAALGDEPDKPAPHRRVVVLAYDGDKRVTIDVASVRVEVKAGYVYRRPGCAGEAPTFRHATLCRLPEVPR